MFLTQPAISDQVRKLEQDCDVLLFHRERKRIKLTDEGERLFLLTRRLFEVGDQIEEYLSERRSVIDGTLRIIADSAHHVTGVLSKFRAQYPEVFVSMRTGNTQEVISELRSYNAEIGVAGSIPPGRDIDAVSLGATQIVAFAAKGMFLPDHGPLSLRDLSRHPLVFREKGSKTRQKLEDAAEKAHVKFSPSIEAEGREAVREIVASGAGIGFVSEAEFGRDDRLVRVNLDIEDISMPETLLVLSQRRDVRVIRAFMALAHETLGIDAKKPDA
jgi:aminoethylphosphonate catabolism LysR family transcriptional regulator